MSERADRIIAALRSGHDHLTSLVRGLGTVDLTRQSGAEAWDVSQVLSHLGSGAEIALAVLDGALDGTGPRGADFNKSVWARWDAMPPSERAEGFAAANETLVARYESLDARTREELRIDLGFLPVPVDLATVAGLRLSEFTFHTWDVEVAFDPAAVLAPAATGPLLDHAHVVVRELVSRPDLEDPQVEVGRFLEVARLLLGEPLLQCLVGIEVIGTRDEQEDRREDGDGRTRRSGPEGPPRSHRFPPVPHQ